MNLIFNSQHIVLAKIKDNLALPHTEDLVDLKYELSLIMEPRAKILGFISSPEALISYPHLELVSLRQALGLFEPQAAELIVRAQQLIYYQHTHKFCGVCGEGTTLNPLTNRLNCPKCGKDIYPRIAPAMIVAVTKGNKLLMAQGNNFAPHVWSLLAGYCEAGESLEQTVEREIFEEVGLKVTNIKYWGSQYWPFPDSLMVGFTAEYESGEICIDRSEIRTAGFFAKDELPGRPSSPLSIANRLIEDFLVK